MSDTSTGKSHYGHTITLNHQNWDFTVTGPEFDDAKYKMSFQSYKAAKEEIEKRVNETRKFQEKNVTLRLSVLDENGNHCIIDRINRNTGEVNGIKTNGFYPDMNWIKEILIKRAKMQADIQLINQTLRPLSISTQVGLGGRIDAEKYAGQVDKLKKNYEEKMTKAIEIATPKEVL